MIEESTTLTKAGAGELNDKRNQAYRILNNTVCEVEEAPDDEVLPIVCRNLRVMCGAEHASLATCDSSKNSLRLEVVDPGRGDDAIRLGSDSHHSITLLPEVIDRLRESVVHQVNDDGVSLDGLFPDSELASIARGRPAGNLYTLSCMRQRSLVAVCGVALPPGRQLDLLDVIETYMGTTAMILQRAAGIRELRTAQARTDQLLSSIPIILVGVAANGRVTHWNHPAEEAFGLEEGDVAGRCFREIPIRWDWNDIERKTAKCLSRGASVTIESQRYTRPDGKEGFLNITINPFRESADGPAGYLLAAEEVSERRVLEAQLIHAQKMESIGALAAGIAHEINTPAQFVGDNLTFLRDSFADVVALLTSYDKLFAATKTGPIPPERIAEVESARELADVEYLVKELPKAIEQSAGGIARVSGIVRAMKEFSHPDTGDMTATDLRKAIENTIIVARNEWKYVADVETDFDPALPLVPCLPGEFNQMILNLITNGAHAIGEVIDTAKGEKGKIRVSTKLDGEWAEIRVSDTGGGIPETIRGKVFDPFFTTKPVGRGTGQGLAIIHNSVVNKHHGTVTFESTVGQGTTFIIRLPLVQAKAT